MPDTAADSLPPLRRYLALLAVVIAIWAVMVDAMAISVALPILARDFGTGAAEVTWVVAVSQLVTVSLLLVFSRVGEIVGYRRVHQLGLLVFVAATLGCALAPNLPLLVAARGLQAAGAASVLALNFAMVRHIFPADRLGWAIGLVATAVAVASCLGPSLAGIILAVADWRWIFAMTVPLGLTSLLLGGLVLPPTTGSPQRLDGPSAVLSAGTFGGLLLALTGAGHGWPPAAIAGLAVLGLAAGTALVLRLWQAPAPLLPLDLFRLPVFALAITASVSAFAAQMLAYVTLPFLFLGVLGLTAWETGLAFSLWPLALAFAAPLAGRFADRLPPAPMACAGMLVMAAGLLLLALLPPTAGLPDIGWRMALCGIGLGLFQTPNNRSMLNAAPRHRSGAASGMIATARHLGQALAIALATFALAASPVAGPVFALTLATGFALLAATITILRGRLPRA
ncbi:MAG TPA: MFS transporter [Devosiaceae bacterium]|jgi:DHA2 family multidrug resistance protein-like MFS transporter|nr:MFS transporter [Devosiaceae bacterium]